MVTEEGQHVSPSSREREYARRRYEDWQKRLSDKRVRQQRQRRRAMIAGGAAAAVLVVAGGVLWFTGGNDSGSTSASTSLSSSAVPGSGPASGPAPSGSGGATPGAAISASPNAGANPCPVPTVKADPNMRFNAPPDFSLAQGKKWTMTMKTSCGDIVATLDGAKAPKAVANAIFLSGKGFWTGTPCHRLGLGQLKMLQCGDATGSGSGTPGYQFGPVENKPADGVYRRGIIAMARANTEDSQGSQFFIVFGDMPLPGGYTVFGTVTKGLDIVDKIAAGGVTQLGVDGGSGPPARAISIVSTSVTPA